MPPLRDAALGTGAALPACAQTLAEDIATALSGDDRQFLCRWFGADGLGRLGGDAEPLSQAIEADILALDHALSSGLDSLLHQPALTALEGRWRGLRWLVGQAADDRQIKIRILACTWSELAIDLDRDDIRETAVFQKIHQWELNMAGGEPFGLLLVDREIRHQPPADPGGHRSDADPDAFQDDLEIVGKLAEIGQAAWVPFVFPASPSLLFGDTLPPGKADFSHLATVADPAALFDLPEYGSWRQLRSRPTSRFVAVVLPRVLARLPWRDAVRPTGRFRYDEHAADLSERVWMSSCWPFAAVVTRAMCRYGWPADLRGVDNDRIGGGLVIGLPQESFTLGGDFSLPRIPLDVCLRESQERGIVDDRETGLLAAGLLPLMAMPFGDEPVFGAARSLHQTPTNHHGRPQSEPADQINVLLCAARFAHIIKVMGRDMIGRLTRAHDIEQELRQWLMQYVNNGVAARSELRAARPLANARISVKEHPEQIGAYSCSVELQPFFQLDNLACTFTFETELSNDHPSGSGMAGPYAGVSRA